MIKRLFDAVVAAVGLLLLSPLFALIALLVKSTSTGPVFFRHERMGRGFRPFGVLKFRTMVQDAPQLGGPITFGEDPRITGIGRFLRKTKLDEIPQLLNVLRGDMSLVGPRPEVRRYVEMFRDDYSTILQVRPGITDLASLKYHDEQRVLGAAADPEQEYVDVVLPEKIRLAKQYVVGQSLRLDLRIILGTVCTLCCDRALRRDNHRQATERS
jgi:lipopolysaccharide/colanic/teichoic acid biosynthesis glycosyltransferase